MPKAQPSWREVLKVPEALPMSCGATRRHHQAQRRRARERQRLALDREVV
jgi:hypothetical protein